MALTSVIHAVRRSSLPFAGVRSAAKEPMKPGQGGHLRAGGGESVDERALMVGELVGGGQEVAGEASG